jgi:hypothetical protein
MNKENARQDVDDEVHKSNFIKGPANDNVWWVTNEGGSTVSEG